MSPLVSYCVEQENLNIEPTEESSQKPLLNGVFMKDIIKAEDIEYEILVSPGLCIEDQEKIISHFKSKYGGRVTYAKTCGLVNGNLSIAIKDVSLEERKKLKEDPYISSIISSLNSTFIDFEMPLCEKEKIISDINEKYNTVTIYNFMNKYFALKLNKDMDIHSFISMLINKKQILYSVKNAYLKGDFSVRPNEIEVYFNNNVLESQINEICKEYNMKLRKKYDEKDFVYARFQITPLSKYRLPEIVNHLRKKTFIGMAVLSIISVPVGSNND